MIKVTKATFNNVFVCSLFCAARVEMEMFSLKKQNEKMYLPFKTCDKNDLVLWNTFRKVHVYSEQGFLLSTSLKCKCEA